MSVGCGVAEQCEQVVGKLGELSELQEAWQALRRRKHQTLAKVTDDIGRRRTCNTAIAAVMELMNSLTKLNDDSEQARAVMQEALEMVVLMLSPITPHICHHLWQTLGHEKAILNVSWPLVDETALKQDKIDLMVQVNGKLRSKISVAADAEQKQVEAVAFADENVQRYTEGKEIRKIILVPGRLLNIVVAG